MKKTVLFVDHDLGRSGSTVSLEYMVKAFSKKNYLVFILTPKRKLNLTPLLNAGATLYSSQRWHLSNMAMGFHFTNTVSPFSWTGVRTNLNSIAKFVIGFFIVRRAIKTIRPDLVYVNEYVIVQASVAAYLSGIPAAIHVRSPILQGAFRIRQRLASRLVLIFNRVVFAITRTEAAQLCPRLAERDKIKVVGEFFSKVDMRSVDEEIWKEKLGLSDGANVVTMLGGIQTIKGTVDFLRAAQIVVSGRSDVVFVVAGRDFRDMNSKEWAYSEECMRIADILKVKDAIRILGVVTTSLDLIAASDIVVSPSSQTHFSRPVIEAWGFGKPVIAARTTHMEDLITHGVNGLLVEPGDHHALANCLFQLLDDVKLCKRLGSEGRKKTNAEFDADKNLQTIVETCDSLISAEN